MATNNSKRNYEVEMWPLSRIKPDLNQPRKIFEQDEIKNLAASIKEHGIIKNIEITPNGTIITGENRWRAAKLAGLKEIPCRVLALDAKELADRQLHENIHHIKMNPMDVAKALKVYADAGLSHQQIGDKIGKPQEYVRSHLVVLTLPKEFQKSIIDGTIAVSSMRTLSAIAAREKNGNTPKGTTQAFMQKMVGEAMPQKKAELFNKYMRAHPGKVKEYLSIPSDQPMDKLNDALRGKEKSLGEMIGERLNDRDTLLKAVNRVNELLRKLPADTLLNGNTLNGKNRGVCNALQMLQAETDHWIANSPAKNLSPLKPLAIQKQLKAGK